MSNFVEIGGILKKGLGQKVVSKFSKSKDVISCGFANGRAQEIFDIQQFGHAGEADVLTLIVKEKKSDNLFNELYKMLELNTKKQGIIYKFNTITKVSF
tara:strand:- start:662 stop:958 length:297 start_codon:yes stop_codon:yes gene_type:complete